MTSKDGSKAEVSSRSTPEPNIVTTPDPDQPPSIRASPGHSGPVRASPVGSNTQFDKLVDPARYYKCRVKDEGIDRTPKPLLTNIRPGYSIYSVGPNPEDFGKGPDGRDDLGKPFGFRMSKISNTSLMKDNGSVMGATPQFGNRLGLTTSPLGNAPLRASSALKVGAKPSAQITSKDSSVDTEKGLSDLAVEMGTMPKSPLVEWRDEARRLSLRQKRAQAKQSKDLTIILKDTRLDMVYERLPRSRIIEDEIELEQNAKQNKIYEDFLIFRAGNENFINKASQTINDAPKNKSTQTYWTAEKSCNDQASVWEIHDTFEDVHETAKRIEKEAADKANPFEGNAAANCDQRSSNFEGGHLSPINSGGSEDDEGIAVEGESDEREYAATLTTVGDASCLQSPAFKNHLFMMERVLNMNTYQNKIGDFKHFYEGKTQETSSQSTWRPRLSRMWVWNAEGLTQGKSVNCMRWNRVNKHLLAAAYGDIGQEGLICGWNLKNLEFPERFYKRPTAALTIDFSQVLPSFLSCGSADGSVCVYNVKSVENVTVLDSMNNAAHGHVSPVWQVGWIQKEQTSSSSIGLPERLISVASDGRVADWKIHKGFDATDLMRIKRSQMKPGFGAFTSKSTQKTKDTCLSRLAGGMTFAFSPKHLDLYLVGTDEGIIHLCNTNYSEQYLETYWGHTGAIFKIEWSPFLEDFFLSCSGDWSIRLWRRGEQNSLINLYLGTKAYYNINWSPHNACVFAALNENSLEIWNLSVSIMEPVLTKKPDRGERITSMIFSPLVDDIILLGDSSGDITVYKMKNLERTPSNHKELLQAAITTVTSSVTNENKSDNANLFPHEVWSGFFADFETASLPSQDSTTATSLGNSVNATLTGAGDWESVSDKRATESGV